MEVTVDGDVISGSAGTVASDMVYQTNALRHLEPGAHTIQAKVETETLVVDSAGVIP